MDPLLITLAIAGLLVGATGTWSPCGFSMIETIGPVGHTGGRRTTIAACLTFAPFAVLGGAITFGLLALAGEALHGAGGTIAYVVAAVVALAAAVADARDMPIVPKVRRQLPVGWRSWMPMPLASAGYGVLLGLGFTTFVLSWGVWALMGISLAVGEPAAGLVAGVAFGIGRALPIVVLAPLSDKPSGIAACEAMAMRPGLYRGARIGDAVALLAVSVALVGGASAQGASTVERKAGDPDASGDAFVFQQRDGTAVLEDSDGKRVLPGSNPALGGPYAAVTTEAAIVVLDRRSGEELGRQAAEGADGLAISPKYLAWRASRKGRDIIRVAALAGDGTVGKPIQIARTRHPSQMSKPTLRGGLMLYSLSKARKSKLVEVKLRTKGGISVVETPSEEATDGAEEEQPQARGGEGGAPIESVAGEEAEALRESVDEQLGDEPSAPDPAASEEAEAEAEADADAEAAAEEPIAVAGRVKVAKKRTTRAARKQSFFNPDALGNRYVYVQANRKKQRVRLARISGGKGKTVHKRPIGRGIIHTLAIDRDFVYITLIKSGGASKVIRVGR